MHVALYLSPERLHERHRQRIPLPDSPLRQVIPRQCLPRLRRSLISCPLRPLRLLSLYRPYNIPLDLIRLLLQSFLDIHLPQFHILLFRSAGLLSKFPLTLIPLHDLLAQNMLRTLKRLLILLRQFSLKPHLLYYAYLPSNI